MAYRHAPPGVRGRQVPVPSMLCEVSWHVAVSPVLCPSILPEAALLCNFDTTGQPSSRKEVPSRRRDKTTIRIAAMPSPATVTVVVARETHQ